MAFWTELKNVLGTFGTQIVDLCAEIMQIDSYRSLYRQSSRVKATKVPASVTIWPRMVLRPA